MDEIGDNLLKAVVIGINKVGNGLPDLSAAASGANQVGDWLERNGYDVIRFVDDAGPVALSSVFNAVRVICEERNTTKLIVYFAGHGFLNAPEDESWLLSGAPTNPAEAISLPASKLAARRSGIPHIVFVSDACRSLPGDLVQMTISGNSVFPNVHPRRTNGEGPHTDVFYATQPGDPAFERSASRSAEGHGLFTDVLLKAHVDAPKEAIRVVQGREYVRGRWLQSAIGDRVDEAAQRISLNLSQRPQILLESFDEYLAANQRTKGAPMEAKGISPQTGSVMSRHRGDDLGGGATSQALDDPPELIGTGTRGSSRFQERLAAISGNPSETRGGTALSKGASTVFRWNCSLTCHGERFGIIGHSQNTAHDGSLGTRGNHVCIEMEEAGGSAAVVFEDGTAMLLPMLRDYDCALVRRDNRTLSVEYTWSHYQDPNLGKLRSEVIAAASLGLLNRDRVSVGDFARRIRRSKRADPVLGMVAALAYATIGDSGGVASVQSYMREDLQTDLFDLWLLAGGKGPRPDVPPIPLLGQSWSFLSMFDAENAAYLNSLPRIPGFWTVFAPQAAEELAHLARAGIERDFFE